MQRNDLMTDDVLSRSERRGNGECVDPVVRLEDVGRGPFTVGGLP